MEGEETEQREERGVRTRVRNASIVCAPEVGRLTAKTGSSSRCGRAVSGICCTEEGSRRTYPCPPGSVPKSDNAPAMSATRARGDQSLLVALPTLIITQEKATHPNRRIRSKRSRHRSSRRARRSSKQPFLHPTFAASNFHARRVERDRVDDGVVAVREVEDAVGRGRRGRGPAAGRQMGQGQRGVKWGRSSGGGGSDAHGVSRNGSRDKVGSEDKSIFADIDVE